MWALLVHNCTVKGFFASIDVFIWRGWWSWGIVVCRIHIHRFNINQQLIIYFGGHSQWAQIFWNSLVKNSKFSWIMPGNYLILEEGRSQGLKWENQSHVSNSVAKSLGEETSGHLGRCTKHSHFIFLNTHQPKIDYLRGKCIGRWSSICHEYLHVQNRWKTWPDCTKFPFMGFVTHWTF